MGELRVIRKGNVRVKNLDGTELLLTGVLHVPSLHFNLLSVPMLTSRGVDVLFTSMGVQLVKRGLVLAHGTSKAPGHVVEMTFTTVIPSQKNVATDGGDAVVKEALPLARTTSPPGPRPLPRVEGIRKAVLLAPRNETPCVKPRNGQRESAASTSPRGATHGQYEGGGASLGRPQASHGSWSAGPIGGMVGEPWRSCGSSAPTRRSGMGR